MDNPFHRTRGNTMDNLTQNTKTPDVVEEASPMDSEAGCLVGGMSRTGSVSSNLGEATTPAAPIKVKRKRRSSPRKEEDENVSETEETTKTDPEIESLRKERIELEAFLFNENNKVNKAAIKYILGKWTTIEGKVQDLIIEKSKLEVKLPSAELSPVAAIPSVSYAQVAASAARPHPSGAGGPPERKREVKTSEVILVKPMKEEDTRTNDELKTSLTTQLEPLRAKLKIKGMRTTRQKGLLIEVNSKEDIHLIKNGNLDKVGLKAEEPKKRNPSILIYDVEKEHTAEILKLDFIEKNLDYTDENHKKSLIEKIEFRHRFANKTGRFNWIVQLPGNVYKQVMNQGRVFMRWRAYRLNEYINITRCYKCHGYGHIAKYCSVPEQMCETCGSNEHLKENCSKKDQPKCTNCVKMKRTSTNHSVRSKNCPEYLRQLELYRKKVEWG